MRRVVILTFSFFVLLSAAPAGFPGFGSSKNTQDFEQLVIPKGQHGAEPYRLDLVERKELHMLHIFTASAAYDLENVNQYDWNKLTGVAVGWPAVLWTNHENSAMVSWRWGLDCRCVELGVYMHMNGKRYILRNAKDSEVFATIMPGDTLETWIHLMQDDRLPNRNWVGVTIKTPNAQAYAEKEFFVNVREPSRVINPWFGGQEVAPHDIYILRKQVGKE